MRAKQVWLTRALLLLMTAFAGFVGYSLLALSDLEKDLSRDLGEDMVWAINQASYQTNLLMLAEYAPSRGHRGNPHLQRALLRGRMEVLLAPAQVTFMERAGVHDSLLQVKELLGSAEPDYLQVQMDLQSIGQQVMRTNLDLTGERRDAHESLLRLLALCIGGVVLTGGVLCWQLLRSLTRVRHAHDEARRLLDALEREKQARLRYRDFVSVMSHQLRTPLAVIDSSAQRLARKVAAESGVLVRAQRIRSSVRQLNQLIARVLLGLRVDEQGSADIMLEYQRCDWEDVVRQALDGFGDLLAARPIHLCWSPGVIRPLWVECDRLWCVEILANLISNADKYSPPGTPIDILVESTDDSLLCSVSDSGTGIAEESMSKLFEPFYRGAEIGRGDGIGLGLSIARTLACRHGGRLTATNLTDGGACFTLQLPLQRLATYSSRPAPSGVTGGRTSGSTRSQHPA